MTTPILPREGSDAEPLHVIRSLLDRSLGELRTPTGTLVSHAVQDLFLEEVRQRGAAAAEAAWLAIDAAKAREIGAAFGRQFLGRGGPDYALPAGTDVISLFHGSGIVGDCILSFDVDRPGLHNVDDLPERPGGSNLALLIRTIEELSRERPCHAIGSPVVVERFQRGAASYRLQFPPFIHAGGVVLERHLDLAHAGYHFCSLTPLEIRDLAADIVIDMADLWNNNRVIAKRATMTRDAARRMAATLEEVRLHAVTVQLHDQPADVPLAFGVEFGAVDEANRRGIVLQHVGSREKPAEVISTIGLRGSERRDELARMGADGRIDGVALAVARSSREGLTTLLGELGSGYQTFATIALGPRLLRYRLFWLDGTIRVRSWGAHVVDVGLDGIRISGHGSLPATTIQALPDRPLRAVFDRPFYSEAPILSAANFGEHILIKTKEDVWMVDCKRGDAWRGVRQPRSGDNG